MRGIFSMNLFLSLLFLFSAFLTAFSPAVQIILGPDDIGVSQNRTILATVHTDRLKSCDNFPEINGFRRPGQSMRSTKSKGDSANAESLVMTCQPNRGVYHFEKGFYEC